MSTFVGQAFDRHDGCMRFPVKGGIVAKKDDIAVWNGGYIDVGQVGTGLKIAGTFAEDVDTTALADGALFRGYLGPQINLPLPNKVFWFANAAGADAFVQTDIGVKPAYINGAHEVTDTTTGRSLAGDAIALSSDAMHVLVAIKPLGA